MVLLCRGNCHGVAVQIVDIILLAPVLLCIHAESLAEQVPIQDSWGRRGNRLMRASEAHSLLLDYPVAQPEQGHSRQGSIVANLQMITQLPDCQRVICLE